MVVRLAHLGVTVRYSVESVLHVYIIQIIKSYLTFIPHAVLSPVGL